MTIGRVSEHQTPQQRLDVLRQQVVNLTKAPETFSATALKSRIRFLTTAFTEMDALHKLVATTPAPKRERKPKTTKAAA